MALLLSEATFDQLVELPVVGPTRAQQFLELREEVGGKLRGGSKRHSLQHKRGAVTVVSSCCANCVGPPRPQQWGPDLPFFGHAGHADPLDGWRCCSQKRVMSRPIQVRQL